MSKRRSPKKNNPKSPTPPEPTSPISGTLFDFAQRLKQEIVRRKREELSPLDEKYHLYRLIDPVLEADEANVLEILVFILEQWPRLLYTHTVLRDQVDHLRGLVYWHGPQEIHDRNKAWLVKLVEAWANGVTFGYKVEITRSKGHRGQVPSLFPHLREVDGAYETNRAFFERKRS